MYEVSVPTISPAEVSARVEDGWALLDVRTPAEWADGRMPGSTLIPMDQLPGRLDEVPNRVICICAVGGRSARVAAYLIAQGREAVNLGGGVDAWAIQGGELVR